MSAELDWNPPKGKGGTQPFSNPLLVRTELAKVKPTTYDLPGQGHTFGKALERDAEDAGAVTMSWKEHVKNPHQVPGSDFRALNREAIKAGQHTATAQTNFRKENQKKPEYRLKQGSETGAAQPALPSDGNREYMYGKASRPSTPIEFLMTNSYLRSFVEDQKEKHNDDAATVGQPKKTNTRVRMTKAQEARAAAVKDMLEYEEAESTWKMSKFQNVPSRNRA